MSADPALHAAVDLFNRGRYLAAHEVLDELWEATEGPSADFYKGLIQASICLHHLEEGNVEGARKLYRGHRRCLAGYLPTHLGIDVESFLASMQAALGPVLAGSGDAPPPPLADDHRPRLAFVGS